jgi:hypothetical protein
MEIRQLRVQRLDFRTLSECPGTNMSAVKQYGSHFEISTQNISPGRQAQVVSSEVDEQRCTTEYRHLIYVHFLH